MKKCNLCDNKRYSSHWACKYCIPCRDKMWKSQQSKWKADNKEHLVRYRRRVSSRWKENRNIKSREHAKRLSDSYVRSTLAQFSTLKGSEFPEKLVKLQRLDIKLKRERNKYHGKKDKRQY
jgi:hypothetical protein